MPISRRLDYVILDMIESSQKTIRAAPMNLGAIPGSGGGAGAPPGGFIGWLPQTRVAYDLSEVESLSTPGSGQSLLDNLNHIRARLGTLESGGSIFVVDENTSTTYNDVDTIHFSGGITVTNLGSGDIRVAVTASGGSGASVADIGSTAETVGGSVANGTALTASRSDHKHAITIPKLDDLATADDNTDLNANTTNHGLVVKATAPADKHINFPGIGYTETEYAMKDLYDSINEVVHKSTSVGPVIDGLSELPLLNYDGVSAWLPRKLLWSNVRNDLADTFPFIAHNHQGIGSDGNPIDHGTAIEATSLLDDDHPQYIKHSLATATNDFLVASGVGVFVKKTLAEIVALLSPEITLPVIGTPTNNTLVEDFTARGSSGVIDGTLTYLSVGTSAVKVSVAAGEGYIRTSNDQQAPLVFCKWNASPDLYTFSAPAAGQETAIFFGISYNAGTPIAISSSTFADFNGFDKFWLGRVSYDGTTMRILNSYAHAEDVANATRLWMRRLFPFQREEAPEGTGGLELSVSLRALAMSTGAVWHGYNRYLLSAIASGAAFATHYKRAGGGFNSTVGVTSYPNTQYDDGSGTLATMTNNKYGCLWVYVDIADGTLDVVYGAVNGNSQADAQADTIPTTPAHLTYHGKLIGRIIYQKSGASPVLVESAWATGFTAGGGTGDVVGPASAVDNNLAAFDLTTGKLIKDSGVLTSNAASAVSLKHTQGTDTALGTLGTKDPPIDADLAIYRDSTASSALVTSTWTQVKAFLKTYWDTLYAPIAKGVTNGDSHDHNGGDGAAIPAGGLSSKAVTLAKLSDASFLPGGRLTLTTGLPVTTADVTAATTIYYTPYLHDVITLWDGSNWTPVTFTEQNLALGTVTNALPYDVFGYLSAGVLAIEKLAWTNTTTRATGITLQSGRYCKTGDKTRLYLGTFHTTSTTTTEDSGGGASQSGGKRFLWNMYNRVSRSQSVIDSTDSWSYTTDTIRQANAAAGNKCEFVLGLAVDRVHADLRCTIFLKSNSAKVAKVGVGLDTTTAFSGMVQGGYNAAAVDQYGPCGGSYMGIPAAGYHYIAWNEKGADGTCTFVGDNAANGIQSGMNVELFT